MRSATGFGMLIGSTVGGFVPDLWHAGMFSMAGVVFSLAGGVAGVWAGYKLKS